MKPYISQPEGSMTCGAYSIAYYLWETNKAQYVNDRTFVENIHKKNANWLVEYYYNFIIKTIEMSRIL